MVPSTNETVTDVTVESVFVGTPVNLGTHGGERVVSSIGKRSVAASTVDVVHHNIVGDEQADLKFHGGRDKGVYIYPAEHYAAWQADGYDLNPGDVGENIAVRGLTEQEVHVGDQWQWGDVILEVTQPREPCYKLGMRVGTNTIIADMIETGRCGWYARIISPGSAPTHGALTLLRSNPDQVTIADLFAIICRNGRGFTTAEIRSVLNADDLAPSARGGVLKALKSAERRESR
ncbi:MOSC domain-containing protein [Hoyosella rhizosphaerae]|uniref:Sulfurase n=1 Tax=Hoyosella rhizosphaerae TaxID=1755582 RepID=A0A916U0D2_9ACTN|nr:MOSC domain-containing protein [Hoyosella rhizosphaerae]MBN4927109.1 MOSC domain-containing protein [Hoyosella rhizosphaerae]GGC53937.1 sulfurase [Hoyosella rhizosphaerae]